MVMSRAFLPCLIFVGVASLGCTQSTEPDPNHVARPPLSATSENVHQEQATLHLKVDVGPRTIVAGNNATVHLQISNPGKKDILVGARCDYFGFIVLDERGSSIFNSMTDVDCVAGFAPPLWIGAGEKRTWSSDETLNLSFLAPGRYWIKGLAAYSPLVSTRVRLTVVAAGS